jgi:hypothetical protein
MRRAASFLTFCLLFASGASTLQAQDAWVLPRTPDGHPDLSGNWTNATLTPFQRPKGHGPVLTREQVFEIESGQAAEVAEAAEPSDPDRPPPPAGGTDPICIDSPTSCYSEAYRAPGERVAVVRGQPRSSLVTRPTDGRVPPLTEEARARVAAFNASRADFGPYDHPELRPLAERCIVSFGSSAGPPMLPNYWYNNNYTIVQTPDHVMILAEMVHDARVIRLADGPSAPDDLRPWFGESRGFWEGETLVVETKNLNPDHWFQGAPPSEARTVTERFTRVDEETILYEFTIDDPLTYERTWGGEIPFKALDGQLFEYACHEGNYAIANVLQGARYQERTEGNR